MRDCRIDLRRTLWVVILDGISEGLHLGFGKGQLSRCQLVQHPPTVGIESACLVLGVPRAAFYRQRVPLSAPIARPAPARALSSDERQAVRVVLNSERFQDCAPAAI